MSPLPSPCVGVCKYDELTDLCLGCNRSKEEITDWKTLTDCQQRAIYEDLPNRRETCGFGFAVLPWSTEEATNFAIKCLNDHRCSWSVGANGALAEFSYDAHENVKLSQMDDGASLSTDRGAISFNLSSPFKPLALTNGDGRISEIIFGAYRTKYDRPTPTCITEIGKDESAVRDSDKSAELFDLAIGYPHTSFLVRCSDERALETIRPYSGAQFSGNQELSSKLKALSPHRVVTSPLARVEVYEPIPSQSETTPLGPHSHLKHKLIESEAMHDYGDLFPPDYRIGLTLHLGQSNLAQDIPL